MIKRPTYERIEGNWSNLPLEEYDSLKSWDLHTGGEPLRIVYQGFPELQGNSILDYRDDCRKNYDHLRKVIMWEPRGHRDMYGCLITPPTAANADFGVIFMHNDGYSTMCGHAIIALAKLSHLLKWKDPDPDGMISLVIDAPCGFVKATVDSNRASEEFSSSFIGVPSFSVAIDQTLHLPSTAALQYDIAYGGAFYTFVDVAQLGIKLGDVPLAEMIKIGMQIKEKVQKENASLIQHPTESRLSFLYGTIFTEQVSNESLTLSRHLCIFADGEVDRSPTGSGVCARMALMNDKSLITRGQELVFESITGSRFQSRIEDHMMFGNHQAVLPKVAGSAFVAGHNTWIIDPKDPFRHGFLLK